MGFGVGRVVSGFISGEAGPNPEDAMELFNNVLLLCVLFVGEGSDPIGDICW